VAGPLGCPWLTFAAILAVIAAAIISVIWAIFARFDE